MWTNVHVADWCGPGSGIDGTDFKLVCYNWPSGLVCVVLAQAMTTSGKPHLEMLSLFAVFGLIFIAFCG